MLSHFHCRVTASLVVSIILFWLMSEIVLLLTSYVGIVTVAYEVFTN